MRTWLTTAFPIYYRGAWATPIRKNNCKSKYYLVYGCLVLFGPWSLFPHRITYYYIHSLFFWPVWGFQVRNLPIWFAMDVWYCLEIWVQKKNAQFIFLMYRSKRSKSNAVVTLHALEHYITILTWWKHGIIWVLAC